MSPPATLAAGATCTVSVTFTPTAGGVRSTSLFLSHDGGASPHSVPLQGTGISVGGLVVGVPITTSLLTSAPPGVCNYGAPANRYQFSLASQTTLKLDLTSNAFDTYLCLFNSSMTPVDYSDDWGAGLNSHLAATLNAGTYVIEVTSFSGSGNGTYTLALNQATIPGPGAISTGQTRIGNLTGAAPASACNSGSPADSYPFSLPSTTTLTIDLASSAFDTYVCLRNAVTGSTIAYDENHGSGTNSRLAYYNLSVGSYVIEVSTQSPAHVGGTYSLSLQSAFPPSKPIALGGKLAGRLSTTAAEGRYCQDPADRWSFHLDAPTTITIDLTSTAFDTEVCLLDADRNNGIDYNDDYSGGGTNSRLSLSNLPAGDYVIEVSASYKSANPGGAYTLTLSSSGGMALTGNRRYNHRGTGVEGRGRRTLPRD